METPPDDESASTAAVAGTNAASADATARALRARNLLVGGAVACALGIGVAGSVSRGLGGVITALGWVVLVGGIHTFGRLGPSRVR